MEVSCCIASPARPGEASRVQAASDAWGRVFEGAVPGRSRYQFAAWDRETLP